MYLDQKLVNGILEHSDKHAQDSELEIEPNEITDKLKKKFQKLLNDKYILGDNSSILEKYSCLELKEEFEQCRNNYRRNNVYRKLMKVVTSDEWIKIKEHVSERQTEE